METTDDGLWVVCSIPLCEEKCRNHQWGKTRAANAGWYFTKSGRAFCPKHRPYFAKS